MKRISGVSTPAKRTKSKNGPSKPKRGYRYSIIPNPVSMGRQTLPLRMQNTMRYADTISITIAGSGVGYHLFSCNGLYDPDYTGTGHQPYLFDQLINMYDHYTVLKSTMRVQALTTSDKPAVMSLFLDDDATVNAVPLTVVRERIGSYTSVVNPTVGTQAKRSLSWNAQKEFGGNVVDKDQMQGTAGVNPTEQTFFCIFLAGQITDVWTLSVELEYEVVWEELTSLAGS